MARWRINISFGTEDEPEGRYGIEVTANRGDSRVMSEMLEIADARRELYGSSNDKLDDLLKEYGF